MSATEAEIWDVLHRHLHSIFTRDVETYKATTAGDLSLYEWFVSPHRMDGLLFHLFMIDHSWAGTGDDFRYDLWEPRLQIYGDTAIASYTFMLSTLKDGAIAHTGHNESRVLVKFPAGWQVVHVHKSPSWKAPYQEA